MVGAVYLLAEGANWWDFCMVALSSTLSVVYQVCAAEHDIFFSLEVIPHKKKLRRQ
jgi:hypothetical protein